MAMNRRCNATAAELMYAMFLIAGLFQSVDGHLYMTTPISRNFWATKTFNNEDLEYFTDCPHCLQSRGPSAVRARAEALTDPVELSLYGNGSWPHLSAFERGELAPNGNYIETDEIAVRHGICGDPQQTAEEGSNRFGQENTVYPVLETYTQGSILEVKILVHAPHDGHLEFFLCNTADMDDPDGVVTQGCFNMYPLDRAEDDGVASPIDPSYPGRYYLDPSCRASETDQTIESNTETGYVVTARYQLPSSITCARCIVQMVYYTGNSCKHPGYDEFNPDSWPSECASTKEDWIKTSLGLCGDGNNYPEEYWNCADIEITSDGISSSESSTDFESPAPAIADSTRQETPTPTIRAAEPFNEPVPIGITLAPATSASSGAAAELPSDGCDETVEAYGQCGGESFEGSTCCLPGLECIERNQWFSQCVPETRA